jgi:DNA mismatch repair protein MutS2
VSNASCEFDIETLRPTYRLLVGTPGRSNAFLISEKLGMPKDVIDRAGRLIRGDEKRFESVIEKLDTSRIQMEKERRRQEELRDRYEEFVASSEEKLKAKISKIEDEAQKNLLKSRQIIDSARATSEFILSRLEEVNRQEDKEKRDELMARARGEIMERMRDAEELYASGCDKLISIDDDYTLPRPLKIGDKVYVTTVGQEGVVTALKDKKGLYSVTAGILKTKVTEDKLRLLDGTVKIKNAQKRPTVGEGKVKKSIASTFKIELDVRGMISEDAWFSVDKYLDDAILASVPSVRIIHGKGTGALRAALWKYFKFDKRIASYRHGEYGEGDAGVTVIELKR